MYDNETIHFLNSLHRFGWKLGLQNITELLEYLGNPHKRFDTVHVAGTNGKGSTSAILESIFRQAGYKTGLYTSPHLVDLTERMAIRGSPIPLAVLLDYVQGLKNKIAEIGATFFETLTAIAFKYFADQEIDLAVVEVGLGGRLDATNTITPKLSIISSIGFDHTEHLGETLSQIAREKGGIVKPGVAFLTISDNSEINSVFWDIARQHKSPFYNLHGSYSTDTIRYDETYSTFDLSLWEQNFAGLRLGLAGEHQVQNAVLAVAATHILNEDGLQASRANIYGGLEQVNWPGRLQKVQDKPKIVLDVAHNVSGFDQLIGSLRMAFSYQRLICVLGVLRNKDYRTILRNLSPITDAWVVFTPPSERALPAEELAEAVGEYSKQYTRLSDMKRFNQEVLPLAGMDDLICVTGSHYTVGEYLKYHKILDK